ncbi:hypothetical protein AAC387_Pa02g2584 [Persea americana]
MESEKEELRNMTRQRDSRPLFETFEALLLLVVAMELPSTCHGADGIMFFSDFNSNFQNAMKSVISKGKDWVKAASNWVANTVDGLRNIKTQFMDTLTLPELRRFYAFIKFSLNQPFTNRNRCVRSFKMGSRECTGRHKGFNRPTMFCPIVV